MSSITSNGKPSVGGVRARREKLEISRHALATVARCSPESVKLLENGYEPEHSPVRARIIKALDELEAASSLAPDDEPTEFLRARDGIEALKKLRGAAP
jgi:predicted transcriptional regulator